MAQKYEKYRVKKRESNLRLPTQAGKKEPTKYDPAKQVEGYEKRLEGSGIDVEKATDNRNFIEKALNLTEDQNFLFDVFELMGRPQQAIFNGIKAVQEGKNFGEGFASGLSGDNFVQFAEILNEAGFGEEDSFGADDVVGFLGDIFLDPMDLAIMAAGVAAAPVTGGASAAGAVATVAAVNDAASWGRRFVNFAKKAAVKSKDELIDIAKRVGRRVKSTAKTTARFYGDLGKDIITKGKGKEVFKKVFTNNIIELSNGQKIRKIGMTDMTMQAFGSLVKKGGKAVSWTVRTGLIEGFGQTQKAIDYVDAWDNWLTAIQGHFNAAARLGEKLFVEAQMAGRKATRGILFGDAWVRKIKIKINDLVEKTIKERIQSGEVIADIAAEKEIIRKALLKDISQYAEHTLETSTTVYEVLNNPDNFTMPIDDPVAEQVKKAINSPAYKEIKNLITDSATRGPLYERQVRRLAAKLKVNQELAIEALEAEKARLVSAGEGITDPGQAAEDFIAGAAQRETPSTLEQTINQTGSPNQARIAEIDAAIAEARAKISFYETVPYNEAGYRTIRREIEEGIASGNLDDTYRAALDAAQSNIDDDNINLFDELFEKARIEEDGKIIDVYVMRKKADTKKVLEALEAKVTMLRKIVNDESLEILRNVKRFAAGSTVETQVRQLIQKSGLNKTFDDIFELSNGQYRVIDEQAYEELMSFARPMEESFAGARFLTDDELAELQTRFAGDFANKAEYDEIINQMHTAMRWYDKQYGTKFMGDSSGYLRHAVTLEAKETLLLNDIYRRTFGGVFEDTGEGILVGNTRVFKKRKYDMTIQEANRVARFNAQRLLKRNADAPTKFLTEAEELLLKDRATLDLFSEYFTDSVEDTLLKMNEYGSAIQVMNKALIAGVLDDRDILRFAPNADNIPKGYVAVKKSLLRDKIKKMANYLVDNEGMEKVIKEFIDATDNGTALIDENVFKMIGRLGQEQKNVKLLATIMNATNDIFKRLKVFSLGFHFKNLVGNASNLYLAGVPPLKIPGMLWNGIKSRKLAIASADLFAEVAAGTRLLSELTPKQKKLYNAYEIFMDGGFDKAGSYLQDLDQLMEKMKDKHLTGRQKAARAARRASQGEPGAFIDAVDAALTYNVDINNAVDGGYRMGYIMDLMGDVPFDQLDDVAKAEMKAEIIKKVQLALFDPSTLTAAEDTYRKYIPFYTFAKKNLAFQIKNVFENPVQYSRFIKGVRSSWEAFGVDWQEDLQEYQRGNLWLPIPLTMKDGKFYQFKTSFPLSDLGEFIENPAQKIFSSLTPIVRAPIEATMNQQFFSGQPIERFRGQAARTLPGASARLEYAVGQTGLDRLIAPAVNVINLLQNRDASALFPTVASQGDVETARRSAAYDRLDELRDLFKYYKQEQIPILTLSEIENINKPRSTLAQRLQAIQARRGR